MEKWVQRWKYMMSANAAKPGVWRLKEGGYYIRGRAKDPRTGKLREALALADLAQLVLEHVKGRDGVCSVSYRDARGVPVTEPTSVPTEIPAPLLPSAILTPSPYRRHNQAAAGARAMAAEGRPWARTAR